MTILLSADRVLTGAETLAPGWVEFDGGVIGAVGAGAPPRPADVPLGAVTVVPGFVDMHNHGGGSGAFPEATVESSTAAVQLHARHGTTRLLASLVAAHPEQLLHQVDVLADQVDAGLIEGIHLEGPWLSPRRLGAHDPSALREPAPAEIEQLLTAGRGSIRMVTIAPELNGALPAIRQFVDAGVRVAVGHTDASYEQVRAAVVAGATIATHLFNAMRPVHHREPGPVVALTEDPRVIVELITDGVHLHPALYRWVTQEVGVGRVALITDAMAATGMADGAYTLGAMDVEVVDGIARVAGTNTIAGSTATMDQAFRFAVTNSGLPLEQALPIAVAQACLNPARAIGLPADGLASGAAADLVVLDDDLRVVRVMRQGTWL